jgi:hypothetical protein
VNGRVVTNGRKKVKYYPCILGYPQEGSCRGTVFGYLVRDRGWHSPGRRLGLYPPPTRQPLPGEGRCGRGSRRRRLLRLLRWGRPWQRRRRRLVRRRRWGLGGRWRRWGRRWRVLRSPGVSRLHDDHDRPSFPDGSLHVPLRRAPVGVQPHPTAPRRGEELGQVGLEREPSPGRPPEGASTRRSIPRS